MRKLSEDLISEIQNLYVNGLGKIAISKKIGVSIPSIGKYLDEGNIIRRSGSKRLIDINPFENLEDEETQYWLGWIISDGNIHDKRITLTSTQKDIDVMEKYCDFLKIDYYNIKKSTTIGENWDTKCTVRFGNIDVVSFLNNIGITENKSKTIDIKIPMTFELLRGLIEGDGSFGIYNNRPKMTYVSASEVLINKISEFLFLYDIKNSIYKSTQGCYNCNVSCRQCVKLINFIYPIGVKFYGIRKYNKSQEIIKFYEQ